MAAKLRLELDTLAVESFATAEVATARGTVRGEAACTCDKSCPCPSAPYYCAEAPLTAISCDYSANWSCMTPPGTGTTCPATS